MKHNVFFQQNPRPIYKSQDVEVLSTEQVSLDGRVVTKSCVKKFSPKDSLKSYKVLDFCLENLSAIGTELKSVTMSPSAFLAQSCIDLSTFKSSKHD